MTTLLDDQMSNQQQFQGSTFDNHRNTTNTVIGDALNRKTVNDNYHSKAYPLFMQSNGPFKVYDHAEAKGPRESQKMKNTND
jgi:hypothetical protein